MGLTLGQGQAEPSFTIGQVAAAAGVTPRAVRLYETKGLLPPSRRTTAGYRLFTDHDVELLAFIRRARMLGLSLDAVGQILELCDSGEAPCPVTDELLAERVAEIDRTMEDLRKLRATIETARRGSNPSATRCEIVERVDL